MTKGRWIMEGSLAETQTRRPGIPVDPADAVAGMRKWERLDNRHSLALLGSLAVNQNFKPFNDQFERRPYGRVVSG